ncbi:site-2 protease family protein [Roseomonas sp. CCTCC AB2023176]|uniref:site-2 protease family protein n=1 Tax=Roseomonas sp. CCTCC AB2023176 TaxID=3342640 RepID=UPI0035E05A0C
MGWSFPIGVVKGTVIRLHLTFLLFLIWIGFTAYAQGGRGAALEGVLFIVLLFLCVLLHEFGHVFAARRYGVQTPDITLLPIGGVARLERIPEKPSEELVVALAGPAVNVVIAAILFLVIGGWPRMEAGQHLANPGFNLLERLAWVNLSLVLFNLIPAFPMDGGRVLRAILAHRMGYARGTRIAAGVGQAVAFALGLAGLFGNPLLIFIAFFVYMGAASEAAAVGLREAGRSMIAADAAVTRFETLGPAATVEDAVEHLLRTSQTDFPVVDGAGRLRGVVTRDDMIRALREQGPAAPVLEIIRRDVPVLHHRTPLDQIIQVMNGGKHPAVGIEDGEGRLVGLITPENLGELMMVNAARPPKPPSSNPWAQRAPGT